MPIVGISEDEKRMLARYFSEDSRGVSLAEFTEFWNSLSRDEQYDMIEELLFGYLPD